MEVVISIQCQSNAINRPLQSVVSALLSQFVHRIRADHVATAETHGRILKSDKNLKTVMKHLLQHSTHIFGALNFEDGAAEGGVHLLGDGNIAGQFIRQSRKTARPSRRQEGAHGHQRGHRFGTSRQTLMGMD